MKVNIELIGNKEDVMSFVALCAKIELLGIWGASRVIPVAIDGDGSANLRFDIRTNTSDRGEIDLIELWWELNKEDFTHEALKTSDMKTHFIGD